MDKYLIHITMHVILKMPKMDQNGRAKSYMMLLLRIAARHLWNKQESGDLKHKLGSKLEEFKVCSLL